MHQSSPRRRKFSKSSRCTSRAPAIPKQTKQEHGPHSPFNKWSFLVLVAMGIFGSLYASSYQRDGEFDSHSNITDVSTSFETFQHLWKNDTITIDIVEGHLHISPLRSVTDPKELTYEEVIDTWEISKKVASIFEEVFGTRDYLEFSPVRNKQQLFTEMIPVDGISTSVDFAAKTHRKIYVISDGIFDNCQLTSGQIEKIQSIVAKGILDAPAVVPGSRDDNPVSREIHWKNINRAKQIVRDSLDANRISQSPRTIDPEQITAQGPKAKATDIKGEFDTGKQEDSMTRKITSCAFCRQKVVDQQLVIDRKWHYLLFNHTPLIPKKELLAVSKEHYLSRAHCTEEEVWDEHQLFVRVGKVFQERFGGNIHYCRFTQNGIYAGQTVLHYHTHFLAGIGEKGLILWLKTILKKIEGNPKPPLGPEEFASITQEYRQALECN